MEVSEIVIPQHRMCIVDLNRLFMSIAEDIYNDLKIYGLIDQISEHKICRSTKRVFYHHIIRNICDYSLKNKTNNKIIFYYSTPYPTILNYYYNDFDLLDLFDTVYSKIESKLPIRIYFANKLSFLDFNTTFNENQFNSYFKETLESLKNLRDIEFKSYGFSQIKGFAERNKLTFLTKEYFNDIKVGQLMFA